MSELDRRYTTIVFEFDIRDFDGSLFQAFPPFGKPVAIGIGNAFATGDEAPTPPEARKE